MSAWEVFTDIGLISMLLLVATVLRAKVKVLQYLFLPASLIAGLIGLALGPNGLGIIPFSENLSIYSGILIAVVFAALPFTSALSSLRSAVRNVGSMWSVAQTMVVLQWGLGLILALTVLNWLFGPLHDGFGLMLAAGFMGGHGVAAALGSGFGERWEDALSLGMTSATVGIVAAIVGGIIIIKLESRRGNTSFLSSFQELPTELRTGLIPSGKRKSVGASPVSTMSIDPLIYHAGLLLGIATGAYLLSEAFHTMFPEVTLPLFSVAFILAYVVLFAMKAAKAEKYFDKAIFERTSGSSTDLLVAFGIASISPSVVVAYALPLALLLIFGVLLVLGIYRFLMPGFFHENRVEQSIFTWGWSTGTVAMGIALLRIVDPELRSKTLDYYGIAYVPIGLVDIAMVALLPGLILAGLALPVALVCCAIAMAILIAARVSGWWNPKSAPQYAMDQSSHH